MHHVWGESYQVLAGNNLLSGPTQTRDAEDARWLSHLVAIETKQTFTAI